MTTVAYAVAQLARRLGITLPDDRDLNVRFVDYTRQLARLGAFDYADEENESLPRQETGRPVAEEIRETPRTTPTGDRWQADANGCRAA